MMKRDPTRQAAGWPLPTPLGPSKGAFGTAVAVAVSAPAVAMLVNRFFVESETVLEKRLAKQLLLTG
jgi:hypothetical protein